MMKIGGFDFFFFTQQHEKQAIDNECLDEEDNLSQPSLKESNTELITQLKLMSN